MEAKVTSPFKGVRDGEIYPVDFNVGDTVEGELAGVAVREGWAEMSGAEKPKAVPRGRKP